jgi:hypothetical protein
MTALFIGAGLVLVFLFVLPNLASGQTKLFRRVWSTERAKRTDPNPAFRAKQDKAIDSLLQRYDVRTTRDRDAFLSAVASLMADALKFDMTYQRNLGIEVVPVLAREIRARFPELVDEDSQN